VHVAHEARRAPPAIAREPGAGEIARVRALTAGVRPDSCQRVPRAVPRVIRWTSESSARPER
jgi:hypothetical protein